MIVGIVLAAGRSRRMGRPKPLLEIDGESFLTRALEGLAAGGCARLVAVCPADGPDAGRVADVARDAGAAVVINSLDRSEQIDSLRLALSELQPSTEAVVVTPVDVPGSGAAVVSALIARFLECRAPIVMPVHHGRRGHPVLFARQVFTDLERRPLPEGARTVIRMHDQGVAEVHVDDPAVLADIDTPDDYRRLLEDAHDPS